MPTDDRSALARILAHVDQCISEKHELLADPISEEEPEARRIMAEAIKRLIGVRRMIEGGLKRIDDNEK